MSITIGQKLKIKVSGSYYWSKVKKINNATLICPIFTCEVLHGPHKGKIVPTTYYLDSAASGQHIDHALPLEVNQA